MGSAYQEALDARELTGECKIAEADPAHGKLAQVSAGATAEAAAILLPNSELRLLVDGDEVNFFRHRNVPYLRKGMPR